MQPFKEIPLAWYMSGICKFAMRSSLRESVSQHMVVRTYATEAHQTPNQGFGISIVVLTRNVYARMTICVGTRCAYTCEMALVSWSITTHSIVGVSDVNVSRRSLPTDAKLDPRIKVGAVIIKQPLRAIIGTLTYTHEGACAVV